MPEPITAEQLTERFPRLLAEVRGADAEALARRLTRRDLADGEALLALGSESRSLFLMLEGRLCISVPANGDRLQLGEVTPGEWVGEMSFIEPGPSSADITADGPAAVLALSRSDFDLLIAEQPRLARGLLHALCTDLSRRVRASNDARLQKTDEGWSVDLSDLPEDESGGWLAGLWRRLHARS
jgi:CRP/FNR family cyclic AMP-dependent transcriptional regulator